MKLFLSPHCDDAVLSCGALMAELRAAGERVVIVSLCTASPAPVTLSPFACREQAAWGAAVDCYAQRRAEDQAAAAVLGVELLQLDALDAIYRQDAQGRHFYTDAAALFGPVHPADSSVALQARLDSVLVALAPTTIYTPLAVGRHVDHQRTRRIAECWVCQGLPVLFYEDYPYVEAVGALAQALTLPAVACIAGGWQRRPHWVSTAAAAAKVAAVACYQSQIALLFNHARLMEKRVRAHLARAGRPHLAEVMWALVAEES